MTTQQLLSFDVSDDVLAKVRLAVDAVGLKAAAGECDLSPSALSDALAERDRKGLRVRALLGLLRVLPVDQRDAILRAIVEPFGLELKARRVMTAAEELAALRASVQRHAPAILELADREIGR